MDQELSFEDECDAQEPLRRNPSSSLRVVAHIDLDCFYVQVERSLNPSLLDKPVAVVQYNPFEDVKTTAAADHRFVENGSIIAVSYEARALGVKRIMRGSDARKVCADMVLVQVPTWHGKADLTIYRQASASIVQTLRTRYPCITLERASIDEVYLDLTSEAQKLLHILQESSANPGFPSSVEELQRHLHRLPLLVAGQDNEEVQMHKQSLRDGNIHQVVGRNFNGVEIWTEKELHCLTAEELLLLCGSFIVWQLRDDVYRQLGFTCSAGIAHNKMLAKLASGMHKPNKQTAVPECVVSSLVEALSYTRIQGFGGKLGARLQQLHPSACTLGDLSALPRKSLELEFGADTTQWMLAKARGECGEPVVDRALPESIGCSKTFRGRNALTSSDLGGLHGWLAELGEELVVRIDRDEQEYGRKPKLFCVSFTVQQLSAENCVPTSWVGSGKALSKSARMPHKPTAAAIATQAQMLIAKALASKLPSDQPALAITSLGLSASQFTTIHRGSGSIATYLAANDGSRSTQTTTERLFIDPAATTINLRPSDDDAAVQVDRLDETMHLSTGAKRQLAQLGVDIDAFAALPPELQREVLGSAYFMSFESGERTAKRNKRSAMASWLRGCDN